MCSTNLIDGALDLDNANVARTQKLSSMGLCVRPKVVSFLWIHTHMFLPDFPKSSHFLFSYSGVEKYCHCCKTFPRNGEYCLPKVRKPTG